MPLRGQRNGRERPPFTAWDTKDTAVMASLHITATKIAFVPQP